MIRKTNSLFSSKAAADAQRLVRRHHRQIRARTRRAHTEMCNVFAVGFRPGDRTGTFLGKELRPLGSSVLVVLSYEQHQDGRRCIPIRGFRAQLRPDGTVTYGTDRAPAFNYDLARVPRTGARGHVLDPARNPSLLELAQRMDRASENLVHGAYRLPRVPKFPRIWFGFASDFEPPFTVTPGLRRLAAQKIDMPLAQLGSNGTVLVDRLLVNTWEEAIVPANAPNNTTGLVLIDAELTASCGAVLRVFEDFTDLLAAPTWNPVRRVRVHQRGNPAREVLSTLGIDSRDPKFADSIDQEQLNGLERAMREKLGDEGSQFSTEEIYNGLLEPSEPLVSWSGALPELRAQLTSVVAETVADGDLLAAARCPEQPLRCSGGAIVQVIQKRGRCNALQFAPADLGRRMVADLDRQFDRARAAKFPLTAA